MRPAIDRNCQDVTRGVKAARPEGPNQLFANLALHGFKRCVVEFDAARSVLISRRAARAARSLAHVHHGRLLGCSRAAILPDADGKVHVNVGMVTARCVDRIRSQFLKCRTVPQQHIGIQQRHLGRVGQRLFLRIRQLFAKVRNHHVPASQDCVLASDRVHLAAAGVGDLNLGGPRRLTCVLHPHCRAVQSNTHGRAFVIELRIVRSRSHDISRGIAWHGLRDQLTDEQPRDACIAVGKVEEIFSLVAQRFRSNIDSAEARVARLRCVQRGNRFNPYTKQSLRNGLVEADHVPMHARQFRQELGIADARQTRLLLFDAESWQIIFLLPAQTRHILACLLRNRRLGQEVRPGIGPSDREIVGLAPGKRVWIVHEFVAAKSFLVEEDLGNSPHGTVEISVQIFWEAGYIDSQFLNHALCDRAVRFGTLDRVRPPIAE